LFAGVFIGTGLGIIFRFGGTTGGVDIVARIVNKYLGYSMGRTMFVVHFTVIVLSLLTFLNLVQGMYTLVAVYLGARVIDFIQDGAYTVSDHKVLYCVVGKNEIVKLKSIIEEADPSAFVAVNYVHEVMGEGFTLDEQKQPL